MQIAGWTIARTKALGIPLRPLSSSSGGWWPVIRESFTGAWQSNVEIQAGSVLNYAAVFACVTLIAQDVGKVCLRLVQKDAGGIWTETDNPAFSPLLRKPNRYQHIVKFIEQWITSKLIHGNTYVLKARDGRGVVTANYILDPTRVTPMVTTDGGVYYEIRRDDLNGLTKETVTVPASEVIHDMMICLWHPLIGVTPIYACGMAALEGLAIQNSSKEFFQNRSNPQGILTAPKDITDEQAERLQAQWRSRTAGDIAVLAGELSYQALSMNAVDAQLIEQLKWTGDTVCSCYHVPAYMVGIGPPPPYNGVGALVQQYYSQCLQSLFVNFEQCWDAGNELPKPYGVEFDVDDLIWMDETMKTESSQKAISSGGLAPNEARKKYYGLGPVEGGETPYLQEQNWPLELLAKRELPQRPPTAPAEMVPPDEADADADAEDNDEVLDEAATWAALRVKCQEVGVYGV